MCHLLMSQYVLHTKCCGFGNFTTHYNKYPSWFYCFYGVINCFKDDLLNHQMKILTFSRIIYYKKYINHWNLVSHLLPSLQTKYSAICIVGTDNSCEYPKSVYEWETKFGLFCMYKQGLGAQESVVNIIMYNSVRTQSLYIQQKIQDETCV